MLRRLLLPLRTPSRHAPPPSSRTLDIRIKRLLHAIAVRPQPLLADPIARDAPDPDRVPVDTLGGARCAAGVEGVREAGDLGDDEEFEKVAVLHRQLLIRQQDHRQR